MDAMIGRSRTGIHLPVVCSVGSFSRYHGRRYGAQREVGHIRLVRPHFLFLFEFYVSLGVMKCVLDYL
jgi:hypothetical protein